MYYTVIKHDGQLRTRGKFQPSRFDACLASRSPDFYQILPIYYKILKTREKLPIFRIFGDLSLWNLLSSRRALWYVMTMQAHKVRNDVKIQEMALERT